MRCKNCNQKIFVTTSSRGFDDKVMFFQGLFRHRNSTSSYYCNPKKVLRTAGPPKCSVCRVIRPPHNPVCSARTISPHKAEINLGSTKRLRKKQKEKIVYHERVINRFDVSWFHRFLAAKNGPSRNEKLAVEYHRISDYIWKVKESLFLLTKFGISN